MSTNQSLQLATQEERTLRSILALEGEAGLRIAASSTGHEDLTLILRIKVDEVVARHETRLHTLGTSRCHRQLPE